MVQHHQMDISVTAGGEVSVKLHYRDAVPDLTSRFSEAVQKRAQRLFWWRSGYERKLWKAAREMPPWARETVRQHILHERASRIEAKLKRLEAKRLQRELKMAAHQIGQSQAEPDQAEPPHRSSADEGVLTLDKQLASTALRSPESCGPTLTEHVAAEHQVPLAQPRGHVVPGRGR
ncbi:MAG: hypothetical protein ABL907_13355 [Hyphomicrobium sp.]